MKVQILTSLLAIVSIQLQAQAPADYDYIPDATYEQIEDRLSCIEGEVPLHFNDKVQSFIDYFTIRDREYSREILAKGAFYFPMFDAAFEKYDLPKELKYLSIVESGLRPNAVSYANAVGLWQFMSGTGRMYGLHNDWYLDDRMDPWESTEAAARHLKDLYSMFHDWELALAAYNCGPGNVRKAIKRSGNKQTFWEIYPYLPRETRSYVPQFVAICYTMTYAEEHNLFPDWSHQLPAHDTIMVSQYMHLETFASNLNLCLDDLMDLNPAIKRGALPEGTKEYALKIPADLKETILERRAFLYDTSSRVGKDELDKLAQNLPGSTFGREKQLYKVKSGDVLGTIAERYDVKVTDLKQWNNLSSNMIRAGQYLKIWVTPAYSSQSKTTYTASVASAPKSDVTVSGGKRYYTVQSGDTLWAIANTNKCSIEQLKKLNNLSSNTIKPGQRLVLE